MRIINTVQSYKRKKNHSKMKLNNSKMKPNNNQKEKQNTTSLIKKPLMGRKKNKIYLRQMTAWKTSYKFLKK